MLLSGHSDFITIQDEASWFVANVGWPCLTTFFLRKSLASPLFILMHPIMSLAILLLYLQMRFELGKSLWESYFGKKKNPGKILDLEKLSMTVTTLCAISLTG